MDEQAIKARIPERLRPLATELYRRVRRGSYPYRSWSQNGEDRVLDELLPRERSGFYVDIGAFHPRQFSNTHFLYERGWRGINVDAQPGSMKPFRRIRKRDTNVEVAIGDASGTARFYVFFDGQYSTFDGDLAQARQARGLRLDRVVDVQVMTLAELHERYGAPTNYDLLSVDCEGLDETVLSSNDWKRFRPRLVVVEVGGASLAQSLDTGAAKLLGHHGYEAVAATRLNLILRDAR